MKLEDVARAAGVSASTVSRVLSRPEMVREETRRRVEAVVAELGYRPSRVARRLRVEGGGSSLIGLVIPDIQNPFFADLARGVEDVAQANGYVVFLGNSDEDEAKEARYLELMRAESVDGVILPPAGEDGGRALEELSASGVPVVFVDRRVRRAAVDTVVIDNERGAAAAVEHLLAAGHRRIGFIVGRPEISTSRERLAGYRTALEDAGVAPDPGLVRRGDSRQGGGMRAAGELLDGRDPPTALVVGNSLMTLGALEAVRERGLRVPADLSIVGFDDTPWALAFDPPLTVVRQPAQAMGARAMELLLRRIGTPSVRPEVVMLQPELVVRGSTGTAARGPAGP